MGVAVTLDATWQMDMGNGINTTFAQSMEKFDCGSMEKRYQAVRTANPRTVSSASKARGRRSNSENFASANYPSEARCEVLMLGLDKEEEKTGANRRV